MYDMSQSTREPSEVHEAKDYYYHRQTKQTTKSSRSSSYSFYVCDYTTRGKTSENTPDRHTEKDTAIHKQNTTGSASRCKVLGI